MYILISQKMCDWSKTRVCTLNIKVVIREGEGILAVVKKIILSCSLLLICVNKSFFEIYYISLRFPNT